MSNTNKKQNMKKIFYTLPGNSVAQGGGIKFILLPGNSVSQGGLKVISLTENNVHEPVEVTVLTKDGRVITRTQIKEDKEVTNEQQ